MSPGSEPVTMVIGTLDCDHGYESLSVCQNSGHMGDQYMPLPASLRKQKPSPPLPEETHSHGHSSQTRC